MNTMKFYKVQGAELITLQVKISQRVGLHFGGRERQGKSRADACKLAAAGGFVRSKIEAMNSLLTTRFNWGRR